MRTSLLIESLQRSYYQTQDFARRLKLWLSLLLEGQQKGAILALDGVRAIACLIVIAYHMSLITTNNVVLWRPEQVAPALASLAFVGDMGVTLFFVLSGFLLFMPYAKALLFDNEWPSTRFFYLRRALRILPAYYVTLFLMIFLYHPEYLQPEYFLRLGLFLTLFMDSSALTYKQISGPFWSLAVEWQFYLFLPLFALAIRPLVKRGTLGLRILLLVLCLGGLAAWGVFTRYQGIMLNAHPDWTILWLPREIVNGILFFVYGADNIGMHGKFLEDFALGMLLSSLFMLARYADGEVNRWLRRLWPWFWGVGLAWLLFLTCWKFSLNYPQAWPLLTGLPGIYDYVSELFFAIGFALCIAGIIFGPLWFRRPFEWRPLRWIGILSYGLYMWHLHLLVVFTQNVIAPLQGWHPLVLFALYWGWVFAFIVPCALLLFMLVERPWLQWGEKLRRRA